jgi:hypothetical protein
MMNGVRYTIKIPLFAKKQEAVPQVRFSVISNEVRNLMLNCKPYGLDLDFSFQSK